MTAEILSEQTTENRPVTATEEQQQAAPDAAQYYYPQNMNMAAAAAAAAAAANNPAGANPAANGANPAGYPYYYPTPDAASLSDPAAAAAAATAAAAAMAASAAAYGLPSMAAARRSRHSIEVGPYFKPTKQMASLYSMDRTRNYSVRMLPRVDKGFFLADNDWTCYRRNYFQITCSFTCTDSTGMKVELPCLVDAENVGLKTVTEFQMMIVAKTANGTRDVDLVQHTAKRDKGPQAAPETKRCDPQDLTHNYGIRPDTEAFHSVTFERIQFKQATANNGKRRAAQQYHSLVVELLAKCDDGTVIRVASTESAPLVVRGRAPGHYHAMATKEAQENAENMSHFPYYPPHGDGAAHYYPMMQSGYYYHPYYWANMAAGASAAAAASEQLAALSNQVSTAGEGDSRHMTEATPTAGDASAAPSHVAEEDEDEQMLDQGESANMTEATATGTPENEVDEQFEDKKKALEEAASAMAGSDSPKKKRGRPKKLTA